MGSVRKLPSGKWRARYRADDGRERGGAQRPYGDVDDAGPLTAGADVAGHAATASTSTVPVWR